MIKTMRTGTLSRSGVNVKAIMALAFAGSMMTTSAFADQIAPTIDGVQYPADSKDEKVFTFIDDGSYTATELNGYDVDSSQDGASSFLICGTNSCNTNVDLATRSFGSGSGYAEVTIYEEGPAGSGYIDPFLREQHNEQTQNGNNTYETAYNTNDDNLQSKNDPSGSADYLYENMAKDTNAGGDPDFNHAVLWTDDLANQDTFQLLLDINEAENTSEILLDEMSLWVSTSALLNTYDPSCSYLKTASTSLSNGCFRDSENPGTAIKVWDMDLDALVAALMLDNSNDSGMAGSGDYDVVFTFETSLINNAILALGGSGDFYFYLENTMGLAEAVSETGDCQVKPNGDLFKCTGGEVDAGFEEWVMVTQASNRQVPVPATVWLLGIGGLGLVMARRKRTA